MNVPIPTILALFTLLSLISSTGVLLILVAVSRWSSAKRTPLTRIETLLIRSHLNLLADNEDIINWYKTRDITIPSRQLNAYLPELYPGPLMLPLRPQETLLYADELSDMVHREIDQLKTKPIRTLAS